MRRSPTGEGRSQASDGTGAVVGRGLTGCGGPRAASATGSAWPRPVCRVREHVAERRGPAAPRRTRRGALRHPSGARIPSSARSRRYVLQGIGVNCESRSPELLAELMAGRSCVPIAPGLDGRLGGGFRLARLILGSAAALDERNVRTHAFWRPGLTASRNTGEELRDLARPLALGAGADVYTTPASAATVSGGC